MTARRRNPSRTRVRNPPCKRASYWGRGGAGVMFTCEEDGTVLLLLRAEWVEQGGTWGIPGGGIGEGHYNTPMRPITDMRVFRAKAEEEVREECGSLPPDTRTRRPMTSLPEGLAFTEYEDCGFRYVTFLCDLTREQKAAWKPYSADGENDAFVWFPLRAVKAGRPLPDEYGELHDIHFGVTFTMANLPARTNPRRRNPRRPKVLAFLEDFASATVPSPVGLKHSRMFPGVPVAIAMHAEEDGVSLDYLQAHSGVRGSGTGTEAMRRILDLADKHGVAITLEPVPLDDEWADESRLERWYATFGFVYTEPLLDEFGYAVRTAMVRAPHAKGERRPNPRRPTTTAERTDPALWEAVKREVTAGTKGGIAGEWSARKAQLAVALYKKRGGGYLGPKSPRNALAKWTREDWRTRSGEPSLVTGERYLPARAIEALTPAEYAATSRVKRAGLLRDEQFTRQPERIAAKTARYRR